MLPNPPKTPDSKIALRQVRRMCDACRHVVVLRVALFMSLRGTSTYRSQVIANRSNGSPNLRNPDLRNNTPHLSDRLRRWEGTQRPKKPPLQADEEVMADTRVREH